MKREPQSQPYKFNRTLVSSRVLLISICLLLLVACQNKADVTNSEVGDLEIVGVGFVPNEHETIDLELDFFDNLVKPTTIGIAVQINNEEAKLLTLTCRVVAGQKDTCTGGTGTCSGSCADRTYDEFPGKTFSGTCKKPKIGLKVCTCTDFKVKNRLGLNLNLKPGDKVKVALDPKRQYAEELTTNNEMTIEFSGK